MDTSPSSESRPVPPPPAAGRVTTRMLAQRCGYGQSTVSMALRNDPRIPEETRALILGVARQMGYQPDPHFARMMSDVKRRQVNRQAQVLAYVILWDQAEDHFLYRTYREYREGASTRAAEFGYALEDFVVNVHGITPRRLGAILRTRVIPGMIVAPVAVPDLTAGLHGLHIELPCEEVAISTIGYTLDFPEVNRAMHDHALGTERAVEELRKRGFRRIGFVCSRASHIRVKGRWLAGYLLGQEELPPEERLRALIIDEINNPAAFDEWLQRERPEVIVAAEINEVRRHLVRLDLRVPDDISLAHLDINGDAPDYAGIIQRNVAIGAAAFDLLLAQILRNERGIPPIRKSVMIDGWWQDGPTLRVPSRAR